MNPIPRCLIYSESSPWTDEIIRMINDLVTVEHVPNFQEAQRYLNVFKTCLVLIDIRHEDSIQFITRVNQIAPVSEMIVFGPLRSDPMIRVAHMGVFERLPIETGRAELRRTIGYAERLIKAQHQSIQPTLSAPPELNQQTAQHNASRNQHTDLQHFSSSLKKISDLNLFLDRVLEGIDASLRVSRAAIFIRNPETNTFTCRGGKNVPDPLHAKSFSQHDALVQFLGYHPHVINVDVPDMLQHAEGATDVLQELAFHQAKILLPLITKNKLEGWILLGHRMSGMPYDQSDIQDLAIVGDHISTMLENVLLYEDAAVQRSLASTLLHTIPSGIIAINREGNIQWFNESAEAITGKSSSEIHGKPIETLGPQIGNLLHKIIRCDVSNLNKDWVDQKTNKSLSAEARKLITDGECIGAILMIQDKTNELWLDEKRKKTERTAFWAELAAAMSHEIRNPLVAINTFAQLITERYNDPEFRDQFSGRVQYEVQRLNNIIEQINDYGNPRELRFNPVDLEEVLEDTTKQTVQLFQDQTVKVKFEIDEDLPQILGDTDALKDCMTHLISNAIEASDGKSNFKLNIEAKQIDNGDNEPSVMITVADNGHGIPKEIKDKLYSPFCTTKARGMGLGLPIAHRTVLDHNGRMQISSGEEGTNVSVILPVSTPMEHDL